MERKYINILKRNSLPITSVYYLQNWSGKDPLVFLLQYLWVTTALEVGHFSAKTFIYHQLRLLLLTDNRKKPITGFNLMHNPWFYFFQIQEILCSRNICYNNSIVRKFNKLWLSKARKNPCDGNLCCSGQQLQRRTAHSSE